MMLIGCDWHTRFQQIAMLDTASGEIVERRIEHARGEAQRFYGALPALARVGIEATAYARWFERLLREQGHELGIGDASAIRAARVRQQKTDARDALHLLNLLVENRFPKIWVCSPAERKLAVRLYWVLREAAPPTRRQGSPPSPVVSAVPGSNA